MAEIFISYARPDEPQAERVAEVLRAAGYRVWRDDELPAHRAYVEVIEERLKSADAVVVLWSAEAAKSEWVACGSGHGAAPRLTLVQGTLDGGHAPAALQPDPVRGPERLGWRQRTRPGWRKLLASVQSLAPESSRKSVERSRAPPQVCVCVLPFQNMSGDAEQEYFSDGISEDITTDLSKISALGVIARNTAFTFKGQSVERLRDRREARRQPRPRRQRAQGRRARPDQRPADRRRRAAIMSGPSVTTATSRTFSRSRTKFPRRSSRR